LFWSFFCVISSLFWSEASGVPPSEALFLGLVHSAFVEFAKSDAHYFRFIAFELW